MVLAVPFAVMRASVDYAEAGFSALKRTAIREMGMGTNTKLQLQFDSRPWVALGSNGESTADTGYQLDLGSDARTAGQGGDPGRTTRAGGSATASGRARRRAAPGASSISSDPVLPGVAKHWNERVALNFWAADPLANGP